MPRFEPLDLPGLLRVAPDVHGDDRGLFLERWKASRDAPHGIGPFVQGNRSRSTRGVLRGLHWQAAPHGQGKLVSVVRGRIVDVAVDLRRGAPTFGRAQAVVLDDRDPAQLWIPVGFAHGFRVLSEVADVLYEVTAEYAPDAERGLAWDDPDLAIDWGDGAPALSDRDRRWPRLRDVPASDLFAWEEEA